MGIDDFAFKKRIAYGTLFIDLKTNTPMDLLDTRNQNSVTEWLKSHPEIELITRDGSKTYAKAVAEASSTILQVGDRWHILHQLFEAIKKTVYNLIPAKWMPIPSEEKEIGDKTKNSLVKVIVSDCRMKKKDGNGLSLSNHYIKKVTR